MRTILKSKGLPISIAHDMVNEFIEAQKDNPKLCFRDLQKTAEHWLERFSQKDIPSMAIYPLKQIGEICKLVSIANVENFFATQHGVSPIPLRKGKTANSSIRQMAKKHSSVQGEVSTFEQWQQTVTTLGDESKSIEFGNDFTMFENSIIDALSEGILPMICFASISKRDNPIPHLQIQKKLSILRLSPALIDALIQ